ncbi:hypothetical protein M422DRAFT_96032, partial [Sphaerobolus stellatus SS14]
MSWFKKKDPHAIPPVNEPARTGSYTGSSYNPAPAPTYTSAPRREVPASDPYARPAPTRYGSGESGGQGLPSAPNRDRFNRNNPVGDAYSRGEANLDADRAQLFSGYDPEKHKPSGRFSDGPTRSFSGGRGEEGGPVDEDDEIEGIKRDTKGLKQDSLASTRNALRLAREAEETARGTLSRLGDQSEKLANTERHLDISKGHVNRVEDKQDELKQLNRSIFRPVITFNKDKKRAAQEAKLLRRHEEERDEHEKAMLDIRESRGRINKAQGYRGDDDDEDDEEGIGGGYGSGRFKAPVDQAQKKAARSRYQFEATASDD